MELKYKLIAGQDYYFLWKDEKCVGKCVCNQLSDKVTYIKYIEIYSQYRGNNYSTQLWKLLKEKLLLNGMKEITLRADELSEKHGKLVKLYESWGFQVQREPKYSYRGETLVREVHMNCKI